MPEVQIFTEAQVAEHNSETDCWIIVHGKVYDVTSFLSEHPGGKKVILKAAGTDATKQFDAFHNAAVLDQYGPKLLIGTVGEPQDTKADEPEEIDPNDPTAPFGDLIPFGDPSWYQGWESPYYGPTHRALRTKIRAFVDTEISPFCHEWDEARQVPRQLFVKCAEHNILAAITGPGAEKYTSNSSLMGALPLKEMDAFHEFIIGDELSRCGSGGVLWGLMGGLGIGLPPILNFASEELKRRVLPDCLSGRKTICLAITEPYAGSDVASIRCEAKETPDGEHYIVNGEKKWITNGVFADYFTVAVRTGGEGMEGVSLLLIERTMPGVKTRQMKCSGVWSSGTAYITFEDVKVPKTNLVGQENKGFKCIMYNFNHERLAIVTQATRFSRVCLEEAMVYAHKRRTFGKRLVDHQVIRHKLGDMARKIEATHSWMESILYQATRMSQQEQMLKLGGPIALLKVQSTQVFEFCAREASQIFGGLAYSRGGQGGKVERLYRDVRAYAIPGGSEEIMTELGVKQSIKVAQFSGAKL
ncbi:MAG: putative acyl-CoA dehydrogenase [Piptocephalis tieghemiana]|nr:MAG: putative acyl-CoA dehydrogenase [Piptocephalis tieghemiana]